MASGPGSEDPARGEKPESLRIVVLVQREDDARLAWMSEALGFWNRELERVGGPSVLAEPEILVAPPAWRDYENYARRLSLRAGRFSTAAFASPAPAALLELDANVVVLLSAQNLMSFAWPLDAPEPSRLDHFIAVRATPDDPDDPDPASRIRRLIAHELGHVLGLGHHDDPRALMCMPCSDGTPRSSSGTTSEPALELLESERRELVRIWGGAP